MIIYIWRKLNPRGEPVAQVTQLVGSRTELESDFWLSSPSFFYHITYLFA